MTQLQRKQRKPSHMRLVIEYMKKTFTQFIRHPWKSVYFNRYATTTQRRVESLLRTQLLPVFGQSPLDRIDIEHIYRWFSKYSLTAPAGANRALDVLIQVLNFAKSCGYIEENFAQCIKRNPRPQSTRFLTLAEIKRLNTALDNHRGRQSGKQQADIIRLLLLTGCRKSELVNLLWTEVMDDRLLLAQSKTGPRTVFLNVEACSIIARQPKFSKFVFPSMRDSSVARSSELSLWKSVRCKAGIEDVRLHDLRHTFASHAAMAGVPIPVLSRLLGHAQLRMTLRYAHVSDREIEAAAERIGNALSLTIMSDKGIETQIREVSS